MSDDEPSVHFNCSSTPLTLLIRSSAKASQSRAGLRSTGSIPASEVGVTGGGVVTAGVLGAGDVGPDDVVEVEQSSPLQSSLSSATAPMTQTTPSTRTPAT